MPNLHELVAYTNSLLAIDQFKDYAPNGLQVEGKDEIKKIVTGVTASQGVIDRAVALGADAVLVHHGYFWRGEDPCVTGMKGRRLRTLIKNNISLLAYHLPLDAHPEFGNNACLAQLFDFSVDGPFGRPGETPIGFFGQCPNPTTGEDLKNKISTALGREPLHIAGHDKEIKRVAWCSGGAQSYFQSAIDLGVDAFITGEVSEPVYYLALENGVDFFAAGHHATERYGVQALSKRLADKFSLQVEFVDISNPI